MNSTNVALGREAMDRDFCGMVLMWPAIYSVIYHRQISANRIIHAMSG